MKRRYYLRIGDDYLDDSEEHRTLADAKSAFLCAARELAGYGQAIEASIHIATSHADLDEYPDYVLALGPRGGLQCCRT